MEQSNTSGIPVNQQLDYDFPDLEAILKKGLDDQELTVIDHRTECLLPAGENYSSLILKIDATIRRKADTEKENLHLVAKANAQNNEFPDIWIKGVTKEVFAYTQLLPLYRSIEAEAKVPESELISIVPKYMGHRNSFKDESIVDQDSLIIMENLKVKGYYNCSRHTGLDLEHATKALTCLARYHALGIAMKQKRPDFAKIAIKHSQAKLTDDRINDAYDIPRKAFQKYKDLSVYSDVIEKSIAYMLEKCFYPERKPVGLWTTISHGDSWTNNILFHNNDHGQVDDVKFVDWAMYFYSSATTDLVYFICTSVEAATVNDHCDDLLNVYYNTFIETLKQVDCDVTPFTRESFDEELKQQALNEIAFCTMAIKFIHYEVEKKDEGNRNLIMTVFTDQNDSYEVSLKRIISIYKARQWL